MKTYIIYLVIIWALRENGQKHVHENCDVSLWNRHLKYK